MSEDPDDRIWGCGPNAPNHPGMPRPSPWEPQYPERPGEPMACSTPGQDQDLGNQRPPPGTWDTRLLDLDHIVNQRFSPDGSFDQESTLTDHHPTINQTIDQLLSQSERSNEPDHHDEGAYSLPLSSQILRHGIRDQESAQENTQTRNYTQHDLQFQAMLQFSQGLQNQHRFQTHLQHRSSGESNQPSENNIQSYEESQNTLHSSQYNLGGVQLYQQSQNMDHPRPYNQNVVQSYEDLNNMARLYQQNQNIAQGDRQPPNAFLSPQPQHNLAQAPQHLQNIAHIYKLAQDIAQDNDQQHNAALTYQQLQNMAQMHQQSQSIVQTFPQPQIFAQPHQHPQNIAHIHQQPYNFAQPYQQPLNIVGTHQQPQNITQTSQHQQNIVPPNQQVQSMPLTSLQPQNILMVCQDPTNTVQTPLQAQNVMLPSQRSHTEISLPPPYQDPNHRAVSQTSNFTQPRQPDVHISPLVSPYQVQNFVVLCQPGQTACPPPLPPPPTLQGLVHFPLAPQFLGLPFVDGQFVAGASASNPPTVSEQGPSHTEATSGKRSSQPDQNFSVFQVQDQREIQTIMKHQVPSQNPDPNQPRPEHSEMKDFSLGNPALNHIHPENRQINRIYPENRDVNQSHAQNPRQKDTENRLLNQPLTEKSETKHFGPENCASTEVSSQSKQRQAGNQPRTQNQSAHRAHPQNRTTNQSSLQTRTPSQNSTKGQKRTKTLGSSQPFQHSYIPVQIDPQSGFPSSSPPSNDPMNLKYPHNQYMNRSNPLSRHRGQSCTHSQIPVRTQPQNRSQPSHCPSHERKSQNTPVSQTKSQTNPEGQTVDEERHQMHRPGQAYQSMPQKGKKTQNKTQTYAHQNRNAKNPRRQTFDLQAQSYHYMSPQNPYHQNIHPQAFQHQNMNTHDLHYQSINIQNLCRQNTNVPAPHYHAQGPHRQIMNPQPSCHHDVNRQEQHRDNRNVSATHHKNMETQLPHHQAMDAHVPHHQNMDVQASHQPNTNMPSANQPNINAPTPYHQIMNMLFPNLPNQQNIHVQVPHNENIHTQNPLCQNVNISPPNNHKTDAQTQNHQNKYAQVPCNENTNIGTSQPQNVYGLDGQTKIQDLLSSANQRGQQTDLLEHSPEKRCRISQVSSEQLSISVNQDPFPVPSNQLSRDQDAEASSEQVQPANRDYKIGIWLDSPPFQRSRSCSKLRSGSQKRGGQRRRSLSTKRKAELRVGQGSGNAKSAKDNSKTEGPLEPCEKVSSVKFIKNQLENEMIRDRPEVTGGLNVYTKMNQGKDMMAMRGISLARQQGGQNRNMTNVQSTKTQSKKRIATKDRSEPWQQNRHGKKTTSVYSKKNQSTYRTNVVDDQGRGIQRDKATEKKWDGKRAGYIRQGRAIKGRGEGIEERCEEEKDDEGDGGEKNKEGGGRQDRKDDREGGNGGRGEGGGGEQGGGGGKQGGGGEEGGREDDGRGRGDGGGRGRGGEGKGDHGRERRDGRGDNDVKCTGGGKSQREGKEEEQGERVCPKGEEKKEKKNERGATNRGREERDVCGENGTQIKSQSGAESKVKDEHGETPGLANSGTQGQVQYWTGGSAPDWPQKEIADAGAQDRQHGEAQKRSQDESLSGAQGGSQQVRVEGGLPSRLQIGPKNGTQIHQSIGPGDWLQGGAEFKAQDWTPGGRECGRAESGEQGDRSGRVEEDKSQGQAEEEVNRLALGGIQDGQPGGTQDNPTDAVHGRAPNEAHREWFQGETKFKISDWTPAEAECDGAKSGEQDDRSGGAEEDKSQGLTEGEVNSSAHGGVECGGAKSGQRGDRSGGAEEDKSQGQAEEEVNRLALGGIQDGQPGGTQDNPTDAMHGRASNEAHREWFQGETKFKISDWTPGGRECDGTKSGEQDDRSGGAEEDKSQGQTEGEVNSSAHGGAECGGTKSGQRGDRSGGAEEDKIQGQVEGEVNSSAHSGAECGGAKSGQQGNRSGGAEEDKSQGQADGEVNSSAHGGIQDGQPGGTQDSPTDGVRGRPSNEAEINAEDGIEEMVCGGAEDMVHGSQVRPTYRGPSEIYRFTVPRLTDGAEDITQAKIMWAAYAPADLLYAAQSDINEQWRTPPRYTPFMLQFPLTEEQRKKRRRQKMLAYVSRHEYLVQEHSGVLRDERARQLFSSLQQDRTKRLHTDLVVLVDQCEFHAHCLVLHSLSSFFRDLLQDTDCPPEGTETKLTTVDVGSEACTPEIFSIILDFAYTGHLRLNLENVHEVVKAVQEFGLDRKAKDICENFLLYHLDDLTVCRFLSLSHTYLYPTLKHEACRYLGRQLIRLKSTTDFLELDPDLLQELLERDDLVVCDNWYGAVWIPMDTPDREATILKAVLCYLSRNYSEDLAVCRQLLQTVRFPDIKDIELVKMTKAFQNMSNNVVLQGLVALRDKLARGEIDRYETRQLVPLTWKRRRVLAKWFWECMGVPGLKLDSGIGRPVCPWPIEVPTMEICNIIVHVSPISEGESSVIAGLELVYRDVISKQGVLCVGAGCRSPQWSSILICLEPDEYIEAVQTAVQDSVLLNLILITSYGRRYGPFGHCPKSVPMYENRPMDARLCRLHGLGCQTDTVNGTEAVTSLELYWTCFL